MSIYSHRRGRRRSLKAKPTVHRPLRGQVLLMRRQAEEMIHSWDRQLVRLHHRVAQLEEQNEELRHALRDAQRIFDLTPAVRRPPAAPSRIARMLRVFLHHSARLRSELRRAWWRGLLTMCRLSLPYRRGTSPPVGWPFHTLGEPGSNRSVISSPDAEQSAAKDVPARSSTAPGSSPQKPALTGAEPSLDC
jgi:hypothetical protein